MNPTRIDLTEGGPWRQYELSGTQASTLAASGLVEVSPSARPGLWRIRYDKYVGAARLGSGPDAIEVQIRPKIAIQRLLFLIGYVQRPDAWRQESVEAGEHPDLLPALGFALARAAERALRQGLLIGYREIDDTVTVIRGRIRHRDQLDRRYGLALPVEIRVDEYGIDIPENQLLLSAAQRMLRLSFLTADTAAALRRVVSRLADVTPLNPGYPLPAWTATRLNQRYHLALGLAELVLRGASYELDDGRAIRVDGLVLTMWKVFEDFITCAVTEALRPYGGRCQPQDKKHHLDHAHRVQLEPDLVYYHLDQAGREIPRAVIDAKYKRLTGTGPNPDVYQLLAYCTALRLPLGHLVYAKGAEQPMVHAIRGDSTITILQHALDLDQPPEVILNQVNKLARVVVGDIA